MDSLYVHSHSRFMKERKKNVFNWFRENATHFWALLCHCSTSSVLFGKSRATVERKHRRIISYRKNEVKNTCQMTVLVGRWYKIVLLLVFLHCPRVRVFWFDNRGTLKWILNRLTAFGNSPSTLTVWPVQSVRLWPPPRTWSVIGTRRSAEPSRYHWSLFTKLAFHFRTYRVAQSVPQRYWNP